jgi:hypothetical protein
MPDRRDACPPRAYRWLIRTASWIVPAAARPPWHARWDSNLRNLWILTERGELHDSALAQFFWLCRHTFAEAFAARVRAADFAHWVRGPWFVTVSSACALFLMGITTRGFPMTRYVYAVAQSLIHYPTSLGRYDPRWDVIFRYTFPIVLAAVTAFMLLATSRLPFRRYNWRYWAFLVLKTTALLMLVSLFWIEGGAALRRHLPNMTVRALIGGLLFAASYIAASAWTVIWSLGDQRLRCPVCLERMMMPVRVGSWSSVLDPAATELLCRSGHGSLCLSESTLNQSDRWIELDPSWRTLFEEPVRK